MRLDIENTDILATINGVPARVWQGKSSSGIPVTVWVTRIAVNEKEDTALFQKELRECAPPTVEAQSFPLRMVL